MSNVMTTDDLTLVERRAMQLREAVSTGRGVERAAVALERAKDSAARKAARDRDRDSARLAVEQERRDGERAAKRAASDAAEAELRGSTPRVVFESCGHRAEVLMSVAGLESGWSAEACRRLSWRMAGAVARRLQATRSLGAVAPDVDWLAPLVTDEGGGIAGHVKRGVVVVTRKRQKA